MPLEHLSESVGFQAYTLLAAGYPLRWQEATAGLPCGWLDLIPNPADDDRRQARHAAALAALYRRIDGRLATPVDGLTAAEIQAAVEHGRAAGYWPPAAYDDGVLQWRALPEHPWSIADSQAANLLDLAYLLCTVHSQAEVRARGHEAKQVERVSRRLGLVFQDSKRVALEPYEARVVNRVAIARFVAVYRRYDDGTMTPIAAAAAAGLVALRYTNWIPADHPDRIAAKSGATQIVEEPRFTSESGATDSLKPHQCDPTQPVLPGAA